MSSKIYFSLSLSRPISTKTHLLISLSSLNSSLFSTVPTPAAHTPPPHTPAAHNPTTTTRHHPHFHHCRGKPPLEIESKGLLKSVTRSRTMNGSKLNSSSLRLTNYQHMLESHAIHGDKEEDGNHAAAAAVGDYWWRLLW